MFEALLKGFQRGVTRVRESPQLLYSIITAVIIFIAFVFVANQFITIARNAQERLINVRVGSIQDTFAQFILPEIDNQLYITEKMDNIQKSNQTIKDFKIIKNSPEGYQVFASLDQNEVGTIDSKNAFLYRLASADPEHSFTQEYSLDTRFYQTVRAIANPSGQVLGIIYTTQSLSEADKSINDNIRNSIVIFSIVVVLIMLLFFRHAKIIDYTVLYRRLQSVDQMKDDFISMASHELKAPLTLIRGYAGYVQESKNLDETDKKYAERILSAVTRLTGLIDDILNVSRLEQGRMKFDVIPIDPNPTIKETVDSFKDSAEEKKIALIFESNASAMIKVDKERFQQIAINLIGNAVKYTLKGEVKVKTYVERNRFCMRVSDSGIGISASEQKNLFKKFYRVKTKETQTIEGTGLGLWITEQIVRKMNGTISVESIEGVGSHFIVSFPIVESKK
jgi:signal transduction histidine kinase